MPTIDVKRYSITKFREIKLDNDTGNTDDVVEIASDGIEHKFRVRFNVHTSQI